MTEDEIPAGMILVIEAAKELGLGPKKLSVAVGKVLEAARMNRQGSGLRVVGAGCTIVKEEWWEGVKEAGLGRWEA